MESRTMKNTQLLPEKFLSEFNSKNSLQAKFEYIQSCLNETNSPRLLFTMLSSLNELLADAKTYQQITDGQFKKTFETIHNRILYLIADARFQKSGKLFLGLNAKKLTKSNSFANDFHEYSEFIKHAIFSHSQPYAILESFTRLMAISLQKGDYHSAMAIHQALQVSSIRNLYAKPSAEYQSRKLLSAPAEEIMAHMEQLNNVDNTILVLCQSSLGPSIPHYASLLASMKNAKNFQQSKNAKEDYANLIQAMQDQLRSQITTQKMKGDSCEIEESKEQYITRKLEETNFLIKKYFPTLPCCQRHIEEMIKASNLRGFSADELTRSVNALQENMHVKITNKRYEYLQLCIMRDMPKKETEKKSAVNDVKLEDKIKKINNEILHMYDRYEEQIDDVLQFIFEFNKAKINEFSIGNIQSLYSKLLTTPNIVIRAHEKNIIELDKQMNALSDFSLNNEIKKIVLIQPLPAKMIALENICNGFSKKNSPIFATLNKLKNTWQQWLVDKSSTKDVLKQLKIERRASGGEASLPGKDINDSEPVLKPSTNRRHSFGEMINKIFNPFISGAGMWGHISKKSQAGPKPIKEVFRKPKP